MKTRRRDSKANPKSGQKPELPARQDEHARVLHHICKGIARGLQRGGNVRTLAAHASRRWNKKPYRCDSARTFALSSTTIIRAWYRWRAGGEIPAAVRLRYRTGIRPTISSPVLERFAKFCAANQFPSLKSACAAFGSFMRARQSSQRRPVFRYQTVRRYFSGSVFQALQATHAAEATAKADRARILAQSIADLRRSLPDRPARSRRTRAAISLEASAL